MKKHILLFSLILLFGVKLLSAQQWTDSIYIIPQYPTQSDTVKLVSHVVFGINPCHLDSISLIVDNYEIDLFASYELGYVDGPPCVSIDTTIIGVLPPGNYILFFHKHYYLTVIELEEVFTHILEFTVLTEVYSKEQEYEQNINIYPNPAKEILRIELAKNKTINTIKLFSIDGKLVKTYPKSNTLLDISDIPKGQYLLFIRFNNESVIKQKIIIM